MPTSTKKNVQIIKDPKGKPMGVYMSYKDYLRLMEDMHDISLMAERVGEPSISLNDLKKKLKKDGLL